MLRFDRYLVVRDRSRAIDLATGQPVIIEERRDATTVRDLPVFAARAGRTLIDLEAASGVRVEVWEPGTIRRGGSGLEHDIAAFAEALECARHGAPRAFEIGGHQVRQYDWLVRLFAREARTRGWIPIAADLFASLGRRRRAAAPYLVDRSLVIFAPVSTLDPAMVAALADLGRRDARPHLLVRALGPMRARPARAIATGPAAGVTAHETAPARGNLKPAEAPPSAAGEAAARWAVMLAEAIGDPERPQRALELARVLAARDQPFEARAVLAQVPDDPPELAARRGAIATGIDRQAARRAIEAIDKSATGNASGRGYEMVDDFVDVLRICQDIEDEQTALARVGALLRERLRAASVAFVAREGDSSRVLARVGSESAAVAVAMRSIETGVPIGPGADRGPVESAWPVRHAAEVIGAVWCRWSAGTPVASEHASTLLGIAAAATAPSVRLAIAKCQPPDRQNPIPALVGDSPAMVAVRDALVRAAASPFPVVVEGESGSGKELAARAIHARSARRDRRFCAINCAALVDDLVEAELFGHTRGAFTGAAADRPGVFEEAAGGTLFLDEVAELGGRVQAKLLRVLQEGEIRRLGENIVRSVDVRIVAATNRPLAREVAAGRFRADLWYRLDVVRILLPALRERIEDLPQLVAHHWAALTGRTGSRAVLAPATIAALAAYAWPGNIRELQNVLSSILVSSPRTGLIGPSALPTHIARAAALERNATLADARRQFEERYVRAALAKAGGRTAAAARELGLSRQGLSKLMGRLGITDAGEESRAVAKVE